MSAVPDTRGILNPFDGFRRFTLGRHEPSADLEPWVDRHWTVTWDLQPGEQFEQEVLPHPAVQLAFEAHCATVHGIGTRRFVARLEGAGRVVGVKFLPGAFTAFSARPMADLIDRVLPLADIFGDPVGVTQVLSSLGEVALKKKRLRAVLAAHAAPGPSIYVVFPPQRQASPRLRALLEFLRGVFAARES